jgi:biopolymer transport protein ExbB/TolQ
MTPLLHVLTDIFFTVMNALQLPVMIGLLISLGIVLYVFGSFLHELFSRRNYVRNTDGLLTSIASVNPEPDYPAIARTIRGYLSSCANETPNVRRFLSGLAKELENGPSAIDIRIEKALQDNELRTAKSLDITRTFVRLCPMLGLMGTLIPIGGALLSLSIGDLAKMSNELVIAFSTTVVGLFAAGVSYVISVARERWNESDMRTMEYVSEIVLENLRPSGKEVRREVYEEQPEIL